MDAIIEQVIRNQHLLAMICTGRNLLFGLMHDVSVRDVVMEIVPKTTKGTEFPALILSCLDEVRL
jgi:hypothetical protein